MQLFTHICCMNVVLTKFYLKFWVLYKIKQWKLPMEVDIVIEQRLSVQKFEIVILADLVTFETILFIMFKFTQKSFPIQFNNFMIGVSKIKNSRLSGNL